MTDSLAAATAKPSSRSSSSRQPRLGRRHVFSALLLATFSAAHAARPLITDDARVVDYKACQVESWVKKNSDSTEYWALPACNFTGNVEVALGGAMTHDPQGTSVSDVALQVKTLVRPLTTDGWGAAFSVGTVRHRQLTGERDWYVNVPVSFSFRDDRFVLHTNVGALREQETRRTLATWGIGSETRLTDRTWLIAESFGQQHGKPALQMGLRHWIIENRVQIDATYGAPLHHPAGERWVSIGLRLLSPPFLP